MTKTKVAIIGFGWVGEAMYDLFPEAILYDPKKAGWGDDYASVTDSIDEVNECDIAFVCVPTPNKPDGSLDTSIVEEVVAWCECPTIVIRSTVNPGTCDDLIQKYDKTILMQPEYLGETVAHPLLDQGARSFIIIGGETDETRGRLIGLYQTVYNANITIREVSNYEAEVIKLSENRAIAYKVAQCQELYDVCKKRGLNYNTIREAVYGDDPRFNLWWTFVYPDKRGFDSKCIPKDVYAWCAWAESLGYKPELTEALLQRNKKWISQS